MNNIMDKNEVLHIEVGLRVSELHHALTYEKFFTTALGKFFVLINPGRYCSNFEIVLKVLNDLNSLSTAIPSIFFEGEYTDVKIICEEKTFKCHKSLLASKSDVFKAMFDTNQCTEKITGTVLVDDINAKTMNTLLKYMYRTKITDEEAMDLNLIVAADKYNIVDLVLKCEKIVLLTMSMKNIMDILAVTKLLPTPYLFEKARTFFSEQMGLGKTEKGQKWLKLRTQNPTLGCEILESCINNVCHLQEDVKSNGDEEKVVSKMAEYREYFAKRFTFEADTEDSHYLAVKRIEFYLDYSYTSETNGLEEDKLIKLLPNAEIQLTLKHDKMKTDQIGMYK
jgi:hypothetical protein